MEIKLRVEDIDYGSLAAVLLPKIKDKLTESSSPILRMLASKADDEQFVRNTVNGFPQAAKDKLVVLMLNKNADKMSEKFTEMASEKGLYFRITGFKAEN